MNLKNLPYSFLRNLNLFLDFSGVSVYRKTQKIKVKSILAKIRPKSTEFELIRIGSYQDGGYLLPKDLHEIEAVYSPGVGQNSDFEMFLAKRDIPCYLLDYSVDEAPVKNSNIKFSKRFLELFDDDKNVTMESWLVENEEKGRDLILQMDIEGNEWKILSQVSESTLQKFRIMVIEFHSLPSRLDIPTSYETSEIVFNKILKDFEVVHIHANNNSKSKRTRGIYIPEVVEITFLRKDRIKISTQEAKIPHRLDAENILGKPLPKLPTIWS